MQLCGISGVEKNQKERMQKQALRYVHVHVYNDFNLSYEKLLSQSNGRTCTLYLQRLRSILGVVYQSIMKQGPMYVNDLLAVNEKNSTWKKFPLVQPHFTARRYFLKYVCNHSWSFLGSVR